MKNEQDQSHKKLALLIDADNTQAAIVRGLLEEIAKYGVAGIKRIYGDWTRPNLKSWKEVILEHGIQPVQQFSYTTGKNATDCAMIIDAMDLLYTKELDGFCIVSSDSDFTRLAARIRETGLFVYGFGEKKTPKPFIVTCDRFIYTEILRQDNDNDSEEAQSAEKKQTGAALKQDSKLIKLLYRAIEDCAGENGWAYLSNVGKFISQKSPEFDPRNYGFKKLSELFIATQLIEITSDFVSVRIANKRQRSRQQKRQPAKQ